MMPTPILGPKLFTLDEANALVPVVQEQVARFRICLTELTAARKDLAVQELLLSSRGSEDNPDTRRHGEITRSVESLSGEMAEIREEFRRLGCVPRSYRRGLVDFFSLREGRLVFLCWRLGETSIGAWHPIDKGCAVRLPLA